MEDWRAMERRLKDLEDMCKFDLISFGPLLLPRLFIFLHRNFNDLQQKEMKKKEDKQIQRRR